MVTGAAKGIGRAIALRLAKDGAAVVLNYSGRAQQAQQTVGLIEAAGGKAVAVQADVSKVADVKRLLDACFGAFGRLDILVNNAGIIFTKPVAEVGEEEFDRLFAVVVKGSFFCRREAANLMTEGGRIVNWYGSASMSASVPSIPATCPSDNSNRLSRWSKPRRLAGSPFHSARMSLSICLASGAGSNVDQVAPNRNPPSATAQWNPTAPFTVTVSSASHRHGFASGSVRAAKVGNVSFASASRTSGHSRSTGCNCGLLGGRWRSTTFAGTASFPDTCHPTLSGISTSTFRPSGSAHRAKSATAAVIVAVFAFGTIRVSRQSEPTRMARNGDLAYFAAVRQWSNSSRHSSACTRRATSSAGVAVSRTFSQKSTKSPGVR